MKHFKHNYRSVALSSDGWFGCLTYDWLVAGSVPTVPLLGNNLRQLVHTYVLLSPSSIILYWSMGSDNLNQRFGETFESSRMHYSSKLPQSKTVMV